MSAAFKVFLLIVLLFGACWAYQFRARDLREWLEPGLHAPVERDDLPGLFSPVERVFDPGETGFSRSSPPEAAGARFLASLRYEPPPPPPRTPEQVLLDPPESPATRTEASPRRHPEGHQEGHPAPRAQEIAPAAPADRRVADPEEGPPVEIVLFRKPPPGAPSAREPKKEAQKLAEKGPAEKGTE